MGCGASSAKRHADRMRDLRRSKRAQEGVEENELNREWEELQKKRANSKAEDCPSKQATPEGKSVRLVLGITCQNLVHKGVYTNPQPYVVVSSTAKG